MKNTTLATAIALAVLSLAPMLAMASDDTLQPKSVTYKDASGNPQTLSLYGGEGTDFARSLVCGKDDTCTLFGFTNGSFDNTTDFLLAHLSLNSDLAWAEIFGGTNQDMLYDTLPSSDGGYLTLGSSESMFFTDLKIFNTHRDPRPIYVKVDASGKPTWAGNVELSGDISGAETVKAVQAADGGYVLIGDYWEAYPDSGRKPMADEWSGAPVGDTKGWKYFYPLVVKLGADGKPQWMRRYAFGDHGGVATSVAVMPTGHTLVVGSIYTGTFNKLFAMEIDEQGVPVHAQQYELPLHQGSNVVVRLHDGGYAIAGHTIAEKTLPGAFVAMLSADAKFVSGKVYGYTTGLRPLGMVQAMDGKVYVTGRSEDGAHNKAEGVAWGIDKDGGDLGEFWLTGDGNTEIEDIAQLSTGGFRMLGDTAAFGAQGYDFFTASWTPSGTPVKRLSVDSYTPKVSDVTATSEIGKLDLVRNIPVDLIKVQALKLPVDEAKHQ